jgi:phage-related protein
VLGAMNFESTTRARHGALCIVSNDDAIIILDLFDKKTQKTPKEVVDNCKRRIRLYESE